MSLSPFEIRLELLKIAKELVVDEYNIKRTALEQEWYAAMEVEKKHFNSSDSLTKYPTLPKYPSEKDIIKTAKQLNDFISKGDKN